MQVHLECAVSLLQSAFILCPSLVKHGEWRCVLFNRLFDLTGRCLFCIGQVHGIQLWIADFG